MREHAADVMDRRGADGDATLAPLTSATTEMARKYLRYGVQGPSIECLVFALYEEDGLTRQQKTDLKHWNARAKTLLLDDFMTHHPRYTDRTAIEKSIVRHLGHLKTVYRKPLVQAESSAEEGDLERANAQRRRRVSCSSLSSLVYI